MHASVTMRELLGWKSHGCPAEGAIVTIPLTEGTAAYNETVIVEGNVFRVREAGVAGQQSLGSAELRQLGGMTLDDRERVGCSSRGSRTCSRIW